jgi:16S rRNA (cytosine967-C5)-methyltransferase
VLLDASSTVARRRSMRADRRWTQETGVRFACAGARSISTPRSIREWRGGIARLHADLTDLLRLGVNQLLYMNSVPAMRRSHRPSSSRKSVTASARANWRTRLLRRIDRERESPRATARPTTRQTSPERWRAGHSHPRWLVERWISRFGAESAADLLQLNNEEPRVILRPWGLVREQLEASLERSGVEPV